MAWQADTLQTLSPPVHGKGRDGPGYRRRPRWRSKMSLRHRLKHLKRARRPEPTLSLVRMDEEGLVLDGGSDQIRLWVIAPP
jgi:hypothetical protein